MVELIDIVPTIMAPAEIDSVHNHFGKSLNTLLFGAGFDRLGAALEARGVRELVPFEARERRFHLL